MRNAKTIGSAVIVEATPHPISFLCSDGRTVRVPPALTSALGFERVASEKKRMNPYKVTVYRQEDNNDDRKGIH